MKANEKITIISSPKTDNELAAYLSNRIEDLKAKARSVDQPFDCVDA
jgi:hypothetical protein